MTGVQTCALPISSALFERSEFARMAANRRRSRAGGAACHHQQPASPRRPFTNRSTTATTTTQPSSAAPMAQNLPSSLPISHNQTTNQAATLSHNITTFTPSDTTPKHPPYKPQAAHKPPAAAQPGSWNSRPYKPRSTPYSAPYQ